jgi:hypothetical protein
LNRQRAEYDLERVVIEGELTHIGSVKLDQLGHAFEDRVLAG